jgi:TRAP-type C4-dicarboxylate transport system permease small subunit
MLSPAEGPTAAPDAPVGESLVERACRVLCELILLAMVLFTSAEVVARLFHRSLEVVDELGGYMLAALTFLSIPVALVGGALHRVEYLHARYSPRLRAAADLVFTGLSLVFAGVLAWQLTRLVNRSFSSGVIAPSVLETPMWIPQSTMLLGTAILIVALLRAFLRDLRRIAAPATKKHS